MWRTKGTKIGTPRAGGKPGMGRALPFRDPQDRSGESDSGTDKLTDVETAAQAPLPVVGIVASAGGLVAFVKFLDALPPNGGMAVVLIPYLDPKRESLMPEILGRAGREVVQTAGNIARRGPLAGCVCELPA
jgi:chemotaxis response regulator CheB